MENDRLSSQLATIAASQATENDFEGALVAFERTVSRFGSPLQPLTVWTRSSDIQSDSMTVGFAALNSDGVRLLWRLETLLVPYGRAQQLETTF